eukprot:497659-Hanusia_phi.AAC.1
MDYRCTVRRNAGKITLSVLSFFEAGTLFQISFLVQNPLPDASIPALDLYVSASYNSFCGSEGIFQIGQEKFSTCNPVEATAFNVDPYPGVSNSINVTITSNVLIPSGSSIVLENLTGPQTFFLDANDAHFSDISFDQEGGVNLTTIVDIRAEEMVFFVISCVNPWARVVSISCLSSSGITIIAAATMSSDVSSIPQRKGCKPGDAAPLRVLEPGFVIAEIQANSTQPGLEMAIVVRAAFNFDINNSSILSRSWGREYNTSLHRS